MSRLDSDGQPGPNFNWALRWGRSIDELIGLCKGVLADGVLVSEEADYLIRWPEANREMAHEWPANVLYRRIKEMLIDGILGADEEEELVKLLLGISGGPCVADAEQNMSTSLPLDEPPPAIEVPTRSFCFTGKLLCGSRKQCATMIEGLGGIVVSNVVKSLDYLVIGTVGSRDWIHSSFGRKIQQAVDYKQQGVPIAIVSEHHWTKCVC